MHLILESGVIQPACKRQTRSYEGGQVHEGCGDCAFRQKAFPEVGGRRGGGGGDRGFCRGVTFRGVLCYDLIVFQSAFRGRVCTRVSLGIGVAFRDAF